MGLRKEGDKRREQPVQRFWCRNVSVTLEAKERGKYGSREQEASGRKGGREAKGQLVQGFMACGGIGFRP